MYRTLEYLRGVTPDECKRLRAAGIRHSNQLLHHLTLGIDRRTVSRRTGVSEPRLLQLARQAALLEVSGLDRHRPALHRLGIDGLKALKRQDPARLQESLVEALGLSGAPSLSTVQYWVSQARSIDVLEEDEAAASQVSPSLRGGLVM